MTRPGAGARGRGRIPGSSDMRRSLPDQYLVRPGRGWSKTSAPARPAKTRRSARLAARSIHLALDGGQPRGLGRGRPSSSPPARSTATAWPIAIGSAFGGMDLHEAEQIKSARRKSLAASPYLIPGPPDQSDGRPGGGRPSGPSWAERPRRPTPAPPAVTRSPWGAMFLRSGRGRPGDLRGRRERLQRPLIVNGFATMKALAGASRTGDRSARRSRAQASRPFSGRPGRLS